MEKWEVLVWYSSRYPAEQAERFTPNFCRLIVEQRDHFIYIFLSFGHVNPITFNKYDVRKPEQFLVQMNSTAVGAFPKFSRVMLVQSLLYLTSTDFRHERKSSRSCRCLVSSTSSLSTLWVIYIQFWGEWQLEQILTMVVCNEMVEETIGWPHDAECCLHLWWWHHLVVHSYGISTE